ncbi:MAG TPA: hypothetical protein VEA69_15110 [Tepidisphaeraceae bacterium]|nr:hypothetical protein [Tepidisphaeraceae bacterium]
MRVLPLIILAVLSSVSSLAQDGGFVAGEGPGGGRPPRDGRGPGGGPGGPREGREGPDGPPGGERLPPGQPPRGGNPLAMQVELMRNWLDLIDRYARLSKDPTAAAVAAVVSADDLLRGKPDQAVEFFNKMLAEAKSETVQRAIRLQLVELYGRQKQPEKAMEHLQKLITGAPVEEKK